MDGRRVPLAAVFEKLCVLSIEINFRVQNVGGRHVPLPAVFNVLSIEIGFRAPNVGGRHVPLPGISEICVSSTEIGFRAPNVGGRHVPLPAVFRNLCFID